MQFRKGAFLHIPQPRHGRQQKRAEAVPQPSFRLICLETSKALGDALGLFRLSREGLACLVGHPRGDLGNPARALNGKKAKRLLKQGRPDVPE